MKPESETPGKSARRAPEAARKRSGQVAEPTNKADKQPRWNALAPTPEMPSAAISKDTARELFEKAKVLLGERKPQEALPLLKQAEALETGRYEIHFLLGLTYAVLGRSEDAIPAYQNAVRLQPEFARAHAGLCMVLADVSRWMDAVESCREAVRLEPSNRQFRTRLAELYLIDERTADAIALLEPADRQAQEDLVSRVLWQTRTSLMVITGGQPTCMNGSPRPGQRCR